MIFCNFFYGAHIPVTAQEYDPVCLWQPSEEAFKAFLQFQLLCHIAAAVGYALRKLVKSNLYGIGASFYGMDPFICTQGGIPDYPADISLQAVGLYRRDSFPELQVRIVQALLSVLGILQYTADYGIKRRIFSLSR